MGTKLALTLVTFLAMPLLSRAQDQFRRGRKYKAPDHQPFFLNACHADVDGDGMNDVLYACDYAGVVLFMNDGKGWFVNETTKRLPTPINYATYQVSAGDVDGDGDPDLIAGNDHNRPNKLLLNDGTGKFADVSASNFPPNKGWTTAQALLDADGDGDLDIFFHDQGRWPSS